MVGSVEGVSVQELAESLVVHRTIASRLLGTLADANLVAKGRDGRYRGAVGLLALSGGAFSSLRELSLPILRSLADALRATVSLMVVDGGEAVALCVVTSREAKFKVIFAEGSTHPLDRAAAGYALSSLRPPVAHESEKISEARRLGYSTSFAEVEPNAFGLAVPIALGGGIEAALNLITFQPDLVDAAIEPMRRAALALSAASETA
ncbi:IclR family transcriptional regulator [Cryobacterium frigoriphilum]|uniref:IclR family transcriptional regulator n=1 Tax=Cryobacterium frigoriphilum TaxID=1259150 RepID=A0A4R9A5B2_9MICO|nr:IclR family transcriptional regulator [Cryobacterium frigoriphilum]